MWFEWLLLAVGQVARLGPVIPPSSIRAYNREETERTERMEAFLIMLLVVGLLIFVGVTISVRFYMQGALRTSRFRRIRRVRFLRPKHGTPVIEETVEEIIDEEVPD